MFKQIKTISALALSFFILVNANAQDFIKPIKVSSEISGERLKELRSAVDSLEEADVFTEGGTKNDYKYIFTKALQAWKKANPQAITSVLADKPITGIHDLSLKEAVDFATNEVPKPDVKKLEAEAEKKFPLYKVGSTIKNQGFSPTPTRKIKVSGQIKFISDVHVKIGFKAYKISDFDDKNFREGLNAKVTRQKRKNYVNGFLVNSDVEREALIQEKYPQAFSAKVKKNEDTGFIYIAEAKKWMTPDVLLKPMIEGKVLAIEKLIQERKEAAEVAKLAELKQVNKVKKVLLAVNEEFIIQFEKLVVKDLIKGEQNKIIEAEKKAKLEQEQAAVIAAAKKEEADKKAAAAALRAKQLKANQEKVARDAKAKAEQDAAAQNKMYAIIAALSVAAVLAFLFINPKTREKIFTKKKKSLDQVVANLQTDDAAAPAEQVQGGLTVDEQLDGDSKASINLGVVPGHAPEEAAAPQAPTLEPPTLQAPGKSTGKPSLIINPDLQVKTDEGSKLKLKK